MKKLYILSIMLLLCICFYGCGKRECNDDEHNSEWIIVSDATCTSLGTKELKCKECGKVITTSTIPLIDHVIVEGDAKEPTCDENGHTKGSYCKNCNIVVSEKEIIPATGHNYKLDENNSSETTLVYVCEKCGHEYQTEGSGICKNGHRESEWIVVKESSCSEFGISKKVCLDCNVELNVKNMPLLDHTEVIDKGVDATCKTEGKTDGSHCSLCKTVIKEQTVIPILEHQFVLINSKAPTATEEGYLEYTCSLCNDSYIKTLEINNGYNSNEATVIFLNDKGTTVSNDNGGVIIENNCINIILAGEYDLLGKISEGHIKVSLDEESKAIINLRGIEISSTTNDPIYIESGNKVEISSKSNTKNYINDNRKASEDNAVGGCIYSKVDLEIKGTGELYLKSVYNNGIATTKDLEIKNLTLDVNVPNNGLKGNDSITIESGNIKVISSSGDCLKTENSDVSEKGNQRGIITINDGNLDLYAACDGIDASYDAVINGGKINIVTEKYSEFSGDVTVTQSTKMYIRLSSKSTISNAGYTFAAKFILDDNSVIWEAGALQQGQSRYYLFNKPAKAQYVKFFAYTASQSVGQETNYVYCSDQLTIPPANDVYYITNVNKTNKTFVANWTNYTTQGGGGRPGGMGGPNEGNNNKAEYSCKGIKADNSITINNGDINIKSHDDSIHANSDVLLQNGKYGVASVTINGGSITIYSDDDAFHADKDLIFNGGYSVITNSYEGCEGANIYFNNGVVEINSLDDGINAKSILNIKGGVIYMSANGDGLDSNGTAVMTGGIVLAQGPSNGGNGVIDFDRTFTFSGGLLLCIGASGMNQKPTAQSGATSTSKSITANTNSYLSVTSNGETIAVLKVTKSNQNYCVLAYGNSSYPGATVNVVSNIDVKLDNGLYFIK